MPFVEDGRGSGKKVATPRTEHLFPTVSSLLQTIHRYSRVSPFKKSSCTLALFYGKFSNQHLGPPPTSKEERAGKVWLATNTSLLPATIIQVVNTGTVWKSCLVEFGEGHLQQVWLLNSSGGQRRSFSEARSGWWGAHCAQGLDLPGAHCSWWSKKLTLLIF